MKTYEDGINDAWNCAKKLVLGDDKGGLPIKAIEEIFEYDLEDVFAVYQPQDVIEKIEKWYATFRVGDIIMHGNVKAVVTNVDKESDFFRIMHADGQSEIYRPQDMVWVKTGERVNMQNIIKTLKGEN